MKWAEELKKEYGKIAKENSLGNLSSAKHLALDKMGRVDSKIAQDLDMSVGNLHKSLGRV